MLDSLSYIGEDPEARGRLARRLGIPSFEFYGEIDSTQNRARVLADAGAPAWTLVGTDYQTAGRGQRRREWLAAPAQSLMFSLVLRPESIEEAALLPIRIGLAVASALDPLLAGARQAMLKWPNDLVVNDGKAGGILCEAQVRGEEACVIAGVGVNVGRFQADLSERRDLPPVFLAEHLRPGTTRLDLLEGIIRQLRSGLADGGSELRGGELREYAMRDWLYGRLISDPEAGRCAGITRGGELLVRRADGTMATVNAGRVVLEPEQSGVGG